ncbi:WhiB family transcriptional regulator [Cellulomonas sp. A375-1]|uniref:WhiB family transcriptional regulator n=1 Tax=Cellulomonas sp. A375-1 TaxID=1672219 RepID=UPI0009E50CE6
MTTRGELNRQLARLWSSGGRVPCLDAGPEARGAWTSDASGEQAVAARACLGCDALGACREFVTAEPDEWGVYGGITDRERNHRTGHKATPIDISGDAA